MFGFFIMYFFLNVLLFNLLIESLTKNEKKDERKRRL